MSNTCFSLFSTSNVSELYLTFVKHDFFTLCPRVVKHKHFNVCNLSMKMLSIIIARGYNLICPILNNISFDLDFFMFNDAKVKWVCNL